LNLRLSDNQPLILSIKVDDFFCTQGNITKSSPYWNIYGTREGSHAMVIVGYNNRLKALKVLNSWGQDWGDKGYVWISYSIINSAMNYACYPVKAMENVPLTTQSSPNTEEPNTSNNNSSLLTAWFKEGYYQPFNQLKIVLAKLSTSKKFAVIEIRDKEYNLKTKFYVDLKTSKEFYVDGQKYNFTFDNIEKAGKNPFNKAVYFTLSLR
jgi:Papain family cysteine protease